MLRQRMSQAAWSDFFSRVSRGVFLSEDFIPVGEAVVFGVGLGKRGPEGLSPAFHETGEASPHEDALDLDWMRDELSDADDDTSDSSALRTNPQIRMRFESTEEGQIIFEISEPSAPMLDLWRMCVLLLKRGGVPV